MGEGEGISMHLTHRLAAGVLAASLVASGATSAFAKGHKVQNGVNRAGAYGQVSNLSQTGFTLTTIARTTKTGATVPSQAITVALAATTKVQARKGETAALANGDYAVVLGTKSTNGIAAARVIYSAQPFVKAGTKTVARQVRGAAGTITASSGTSLTIQTGTGKSLTFTITAKTNFRVNGTKAAAAPTLTVGQKARVLYTVDATSKSLIARVIAVRTAASQ